MGNVTLRLVLNNEKEDEMLQKEKHAPWDFLINDGEWEVFDAYGHTVACNLTEANARLIAAAPDLLEALQELTKAIEFDRAVRGGEGIMRKPLNTARAALAKVTGD